MSPAAFYLIASLYLNSEKQIKLALVLSCFLGLLMVAILVGCISRLLNSSPVGPTSLVVYILILVYLIAGVLHPTELKCLLPGVLYFFSLPSAFVILNMYAIINLNNVSWGTRETKPSYNNTSNRRSDRMGEYFAGLFKMKPNQELNKNLESLVEAIDKFNKKVNRIAEKGSLKNGYMERKLENDLKDIQSPESSIKMDLDIYLEDKQSWMDHECLKHCEKTSLDGSETKFFETLIEKHLYPIKMTKVKQDEITEELNELRDKCCFGFMLLNAFWIVFVLCLQLLHDKLRDKIYIVIWFYTKEPIYYEPVSFIFVSLFIIVICVQFFAMTWHRTFTFIQLLRNTRLRGRSEKTLKQENINGTGNHQQTQTQDSNDVSTDIANTI